MRMLRGILPLSPRTRSRSSTSAVGRPDLGLPATKRIPQSCAVAGRKGTLGCEQHIIGVCRPEAVFRSRSSGCGGRGLFRSRSRRLDSIYGNWGGVGSTPPRHGSGVDRSPPRTPCSPEVTGRRQHLNRHLGGLPTEGICQHPPMLPFGLPAEGYLTPFGSFHSVPRRCVFPMPHIGNKRKTRGKDGLSVRLRQTRHARRYALAPDVTRQLM